jgi:uncharacterized protein YqgV (UPF0045/DUF77 family)
MEPGQLKPLRVIGATVAVYPLERRSPGLVHRAIEALRATGVHVDDGPMTTLVTGPVDQVFQAIRDAYDTASATGPTVMTITLSNACPLPAVSENR